jgi:Sec-independent protein translocase protein TatA
LRDGSPCPNSTCTFISYSNGTAVFNVNDFTGNAIYSVTGPGVSPPGPGPSGAGGGGGGGGAGAYVPAPAEVKEEKKEAPAVAAGCREDWECTPWSKCVNGTETRTCSDKNACGTEFKRPNETRRCITISTEKLVMMLTWISVLLAIVIIFMILRLFFAKRKREDIVEKLRRMIEEIKSEIEENKMQAAMQGYKALDSSLQEHKDDISKKDFSDLNYERSKLYEKLMHM